MTNAEIASLLAVLREGGATSATFHPDGSLASVMMGATQALGGEITTAAPTTMFADDQLPPGAYDPVALAKRQQGG